MRARIVVHRGVRRMHTAITRCAARRWILASKYCVQSIGLDCMTPDRVDALS
jgi:hypothetical protein